MEKMNIVSFSLQELYNGANKRFRSMMVVLYRHIME